MKKMNKDILDGLLSQYIDGMLPEQQAKDVESLLAMDASARKQVEELKKLKGLLASNQKLTPDIGFWTRFSVAMEEKKNEEHNLLPFPRKYVPAAALLVTTVFVVVGALVVQNRMRFIEFFSKKSQAVKSVYENKSLQSSLLPLFSKIDKDNTLQFSLFGTLDLDEKSETSLRVDEQSEKGYRIEVGKDLKNKNKSITFDKFISEVKPSFRQKKVIDSLLELTGRRIESSVLIGDNNTMAIAPDLPRLNRMMVTNIASCLEPNQRVRFERLLEANNAPYTVVTKRTQNEKGGNSFADIQKKSQGDRFVIITPDTMMYSQIQIDFDSLRRRMEEDFAAFAVRRDAILKRMMTEEFQNVQGTNAVPPSNLFNNEEGFSIEINTQSNESDQQQMRVVIQPRNRKQTTMSGTRGRTMQVRASQDTTSNGLTNQP